MFTQRAVLLGFVALCFYLIAAVNTLPGFYYALTWLSVGMLGASFGIALLSLVGLSCELEVTRSRASASLEASKSAGAQVSAAISNGGTLNKTNVILEMRLINAQNEVQLQRFLLEAVPSGVAIDSVLPLSRLNRGRYQLQSARLMGSDVLGLFRTQKKVSAGETARDIIIGPAVLRGDFHPTGSSNGALSGSHRAFQARHGEELRGTRPYAPGDDLRHVHWKSSARAGELVVKEFEQTGQSSALVIWDGASQTSWGASGLNSVEWGLILSASLCQAFLSVGTPCEFGCLDAAPHLVQSRSLTSGELPVELVDVLSGASANREGSSENALMSFAGLKMSLNSAIIVVSASLSTDLVRTARALKARGARVQVLLIDGAALLQRAQDPRSQGQGSRSRAARLSLPKSAIQNCGNENIIVSSANFEIQCERLRAVGVEVVQVVSSPTQDAETTLRMALRTVFEAPGLRRLPV